LAAAWQYGGDDDRGRVWHAERQGEPRGGGGGGNNNDVEVSKSGKVNGHERQDGEGGHSTSLCDEERAVTLDRDENRHW